MHLIIKAWFFFIFDCITKLHGGRYFRRIYIIFITQYKNNYWSGYEEQNRNYRQNYRGGIGSITRKQEIKSPAHQNSGGQGENNFPGEVLMIRPTDLRRRPADKDQAGQHYN